MILKNKLILRLMIIKPNKIKNQICKMINNKILLIKRNKMFI